MFTHICSSAPNMFAKFGWKTRTFCHKKVAKVIAKLSQTDYSWLRQIAQKLHSGYVGAHLSL